MRKLRSRTAIATKRALVVCSVEEEPDLVWVLHGKVLDDYGKPDMTVFRTKKTWINEVPADGKTTPVERDGLMACGVTPNFVEEGKSRQRC